MIKNVNLKPFEVSYKFPAYVYGNDIESYTLIATVHEHYKIILGKLTIGTSESGSATSAALKVILWRQKMLW